MVICFFECNEIGVIFIPTVKSEVDADKEQDEVETAVNVGDEVVEM